METHSSIFVLGFFNGLEPGGLELMIRKGKRELEGGRVESSRPGQLLEREGVA